ncbi:MAG: hypothetical protein GY827_03665 [Cytophagales bacterium]|nr:hypothetical protein [Cytophagales bacterium]
MNNIQHYLWGILIFLIFACKQGGEKVVHIRQYDAKEQLRQQLLYLDEVMEDDESNTQAYFLKAKLYENNRQYKLALEWINKAIQRNNSTANYHFLKSRLLYKQKNYDKALVSALNAEGLGMSYIELYELLAKINTELKQTTDAERYINRISQLDPYNYNLNLLRAINSYHASDTVYAIRRFQLAIRDSLNIEECVQYLAKIHLARKEFKEAYQKITALSEKVKDPTELYYLQGKIVAGQGFADSAYIYYYKAWKLDTLHQELVLDLAMLNVERENFDSTLYYLNKVEEDSTFNLFKVKADAYFGLRDYPKSTECYQKALLFEQETDYITRQLARIEWRINYNNKQRAIRDSASRVEQPVETPNLVEQKDSL